MALQLHVNGACLLSLDDVDCGYSVDGFTLTFNYFYDDVYCDVYGPKMPYDTQIFLQDCIIKGDVIVYDIDTLESWIGPWGSNGALGTMGSAGDLMIQNSWAGALSLSSLPLGTGLTDEEHCWNFANAYTVNATSANFGTRKTVYSMEFRALLPQAENSLDQELFTTDC